VRADREWQQQVGHLRERVKEREDTEHRILFADAHRIERAIPFGKEVRVREHHALRIGRRARGVQDHGRILRTSRAHAGVAGVVLV
jgi:hypothetical protein